MSLPEGKRPTRFARHKYFAQGSNASATEFLSLFHRYGYIYKWFDGDKVADDGASGESNDNTWLSAKDERWALTDSEILKAVACVHNKFVGTRSGRASRFALLDIDANSRYHNPESVHKIQSLLAEAGLAESTVYQSSASGGWHIYISFDEPISSRDLRKQLVNFLQLNDYEIASGTLEVFPNPGNSSLGYGLRLPLQPGFAWLNQRSLQVSHERSDMNAQHALDWFVADFNNTANSYHDFHQFKSLVERQKQAITDQVDNTTPKMAEVVPIHKRRPLDATNPADGSVIEIFGFSPPNILAEVWLRGRQYYEEGLTGDSQRADATKKLSHYFFFGDPSRQIPARGYGRKGERDEAITEIIYGKHNDFSVDVARGKFDARAQITRCANWEPHHRRGQGHSQAEFEPPIAWIRANANRALAARNRIAQAVVSLSGQTFSLRTLRSVAKCSMDTIYKNTDLWQTAYQQNHQTPLASDPGEYNAVESSPSVPSDRRFVLESLLRSSDLSSAVSAEEHEVLASWYREVAQFTSLTPQDLSFRSLKPVVSVLSSLLERAPTAPDYAA
ncbi:MAG: hypothetical protein K2Z81_12670, partial [Cyanobacteria bacterium]|nr:hypothetical protein [Cyanobacteriota bacterium]